MLNELKLNFVAVASHELRTPATAVYGALATVFERPALPADVREQMLRVAYAQSDRLRLLLEQLLDLSRLDERLINVTPRPVAVRSLLVDILNELVPDGSQL